MRRLSRWIGDTRGASTVEVLLLVGCVAVICAGAMRGFGREVNAKVTGQAQCVASLDCDASNESNAAPRGEGVSLDERIAQSQSAAAPPAAAAPAPAPAPAPPPAPAAEPAQPPTHPHAVVGERVIDWGKGVGKQAIDTVTSLYGVVTDLPGTWDGLVYTTKNPKEAASTIWASMKDSFYENPSEFIGRATFEVATLGIGLVKVPAKVATAAKVAQGVRATKVLRAVDKAKDAANSDAAKATARTNDAAGHADTVSVEESERNP